MNELKTCPFCGGTASHGTIKYAADQDIVKLNGGQEIWHYCNCISCGVNNRGLIGHRTPEDATKHWNTRDA